MDRPLPARAESGRAGRLCHVQVLTLYRRPVFDDPDAAAAVQAAVALPWPWRRARVLAWRLWPDQWQGLLSLDPDEALVAVVGRFKVATSRAVAPRHRVNGWLWGRGFRDRRLPPGTDPAAEARALLGEAPGSR